jgi:hypothetical protein
MTVGDCRLGSSEFKTDFLSDSLQIARSCRSAKTSLSSNFSSIGDDRLCG